MNNTKIAIFAGGPSLEREISLKSANNIIKILKENFDKITLVEVTKTKEWINKDNEKKIEKIENFLETFDLVINYIHGEYGEDGELQKIFENNNTLFLGSSSDSLKNTIKKDTTVEICKNNNIQTTNQIKFSKNTDKNIDYNKIFKTLNSEKLIVKPLDGGSSFGVSVANNFKELQKSITEAFTVSNEIVIESFISGREFSCGIVFDAKKKNEVVLPVVEITFGDRDFFDYDAKYNGFSEEICPANIPKELSTKIQKITKKAFSVLKLKDFSRIDFIVNKDNEVFLIEANTIPGFTNESILPKELREEKINISEFFKNLIEYKIKNKK